MLEIRAIKWNGLNVVSTFSGCGGSCLGYRMAGYRVLWASEFIEAAAEVYKLNHPNSILDRRDIRQVKPEEIVEAVDGKQIDILDGSPPCASFSTAGKREAGWGKVKKYSDTKQRVDDLFFEFARILKGLQPRVFVAENVSGLVKGTAKGYFLEILAALKACGYRVRCKVLDAQWLGVPQMRQRTIFVGVHDDLKRDPVYPKPLPYRYSVRDVLPSIVSHEFMAPQHTVAFASASKPAYTVSQLGNFSKKGAAYTRVTTDDGVTRSFTINELKRICAFPDDFQLTGSFAQQWERLGRAVPPVMMAAIASTIRDEVLNDDR